MLSRKDASERNQDSKAIAAESGYLAQKGQYEGYPPSSGVISTCATLAVDVAAASDSSDNTQSPTTTSVMILTWRDGNFTNTQYASTNESVVLQGITKPITVTRKQKAV